MLVYKINGYNEIILIICRRANDPARYYFDNEIIKPSAEFLISLFFENSQVTKNSLGSKADWRKRPIHPELLMYSAMDAWYPLRIFYKLYQIVSNRHACMSLTAV